MVEKKLKEILAKKSISKEFAVDNIVMALKMAEEKGDVNNFLKANDYLMDLLEMKPNKKMITDTIQVDVTKQIADTIAQEDKRLTLHVLAVMHKADPKWMSNYALDALKEVESLGYQYESFKDQLN